MSALGVDASAAGSDSTANSRFLEVFKVLQGVLFRVEFQICRARASSRVAVSRSEGIPAAGEGDVESDHSQYGTAGRVFSGGVPES